MAFIYYKKHKLESEIKKLQKHTEDLIEIGEMDKYWLFVYECLEELNDNDWSGMKKKKVSFLKHDYR